jgi:ribosomal protein L40E
VTAPNTAKYHCHNRVWDAVARLPVHAYDVQGKARALCFSPDGKHIAVGMHSGQLIILTEDATAVVASVKVSACMQCAAHIIPAESYCKKCVHTYSVYTTAVWYSYDVLPLCIAVKLADTHCLQASQLGHACSQ